jgi:hypothetical protein
MTSDAIDAADLPAAIRDWVDLIGLEAVWRIVQRWGGTPLYIPTPERLGYEHELAQHVGYERAQMLCRHIQHGDYVLVPLCRDALRGAKRRQMLDELKHDSPDIVARRHGLHRRTIFRLLREAGADRRQRDLFDNPKPNHRRRGQ